MLGEKKAETAGGARGLVVATHGIRIWVLLFLIKIKINQMIISCTWFYIGGAPPSFVLQVRSTVSSFREQRCPAYPPPPQHSLFVDLFPFVRNNQYSIQYSIFINGSNSVCYLQTCSVHRPSAALCEDKTTLLLQVGEGALKQR